MGSEMCIRDSIWIFIAHHNSFVSMVNLREAGCHWLRNVKLKVYGLILGRIFTLEDFKIDFNGLFLGGTKIFAFLF